MRVNGTWVGWGLGDWSHNPDGSDHDATVRNFKAFARRMYRSYMGDLADTNVFDQQLYDRLVMMQDKLVANGRLVPGKFIRGVLDLPTQEVSGFRKPRDRTLPIIFTVEGHMSNMFAGPCASVASTLEAQGVCRWKPVAYDCTSLPFNNRSGVVALTDMLNANAIEGPPVDSNNFDGPKIMWPFGPEVPWGVVSFSQGAMVASECMEQKVLNGPLSWRLPAFKRGLAYGNPRREKGACVPWARTPPPRDTSGIMDDDFVTTGTVLQGRWGEHPNDGDEFAVNTDDERGLNKTAIAKIVTENSWFGGPAAVFARVMSILGNVPAEAIPVIRSIVDMVMFLAANPNPHYTTVAEPGDVEWMRGVAA